jgi:hypothetical protein
MKKIEGFTESVLTLDPKSAVGLNIPANLNANKVSSDGFNSIDKLFDAELKKASK